MLERTLSGGPPCGSPAFVEGLEKRFCRGLEPGRPGLPREKRRRGSNRFMSQEYQEGGWGRRRSCGRPVGQAGNGVAWSGAEHGL